MRNEAIETARIEGRLLRIEFNRLGDRFGHVISAIDPSGAIQPLLESLEGTPTDNWPPSPPLQSLSIETLPDGRRAALLVGMAGGSHWSASIEPISGRAELLFDLACRHTKEPTWLGSKYRQLSGQDVAIHGEIAMSLHGEQGKIIGIEPISHRANAGTTRWRFLIRQSSEPLIPDP